MKLTNYLQLYPLFLFVEPDPPQNVSATLLGSYSVEVSWSQPINPRGIVAKYKIYYRVSSKQKMSDDQDITTVSGLETTVNLTSLFPFTLYFIQVTAVNVRRSDGKVLEGTASKKVSVKTAEAGMHPKSVHRICVVTL